MEDIDNFIEKAENPVTKYKQILNGGPNILLHTDKIGECLECNCIFKLGSFVEGHVFVIWDLHHLLLMFVNKNQISILLLLPNQMNKSYSA